MLFVKYLLITGGFALLFTAAGILVWDLYLIFRPRPLSLTGGEAELPGLGSSPVSSLRWRGAASLAAFALIPLLLGISIAVVPGGHAGVRVSQFGGALPGTLYPGVHWVTPLVEHVELLNIRDRVFSTALGDDPKKKTDTLRVQTKEGLGVVLAVTVRFKLDPSKLSYIYSNLPQPVEEEIVPPTVASAFREAAPNYTVREIFATKRDEMARPVAAQITQKLAADGVVVKEIMLRDIQLPAEYAKGMEGLLLKEQENERLGTEQDIKLKEVKIAEVEADAQKAR